MSKYVSVKDSNGYDFTHTFSSSDWDTLCTLCGRRNGKVDLLEDPATIDGDTVFLTLKSPGGSRIYDMSASDLFSWRNKND